MEAGNDKSGKTIFYGGDDMPKEFLLTAGDGVQLASYLWEPAEGQDVKACMVIVHGVGEHAMRYDEYAEYFTSRGIAVLSMDLRGHGKSPGKRGHTSPRGRILEDVDFLCYSASEKYPGKPVFIYGHSMGGNIGLAHRLYGAFRPQGYVITSPWLILYQPLSGLKLKLLKLLAAIKPDLCIKSGIKSDDITGDKAEAEIHHADKMAHGFISLKTGVDCTNYAEEIFKRSGEDHGNLLLMQGTADHICSIEGSRRFMEKAGAGCTFREWEGCRHELQHDIKRDEVKTVIADWVLDKQCSLPQSP